MAQEPRSPSSANGRQPVAEFCPYCMSRVEPGQSCPVCGLTKGAYTPSPHHLPLGTILAGRYLVGRALGEGGFGITYIGCDLRLEMKVAIKEYFPVDRVSRYATSDLSVISRVGTSSRDFELGLKRFLYEARTMARLEKQPQIVMVRDFFEANNTAYIVMEYVEGTNFIELAAKGFYDNLKFHAKKPGSVVLGGCPTTRTMGPAQVLAAAQGAIRGMHPGTGDARYTIIDEWEGNPRNRHVLGSLCMAHKSAPNSGSCQFYFSLGEQPEFDDQYTVFGQVTEGLEVIEQLAIGDAIRSIAIEGADEEALAAAIARETPRPPTPQEALAAIERERAERAAAEAAAVAGEAAE